MPDPADGPSLPVGVGVLARGDHREEGVTDDVITVPKGQVRITWARLGKDLVHVLSLPEDADQCVCVVCEQRVIARRGNERSWHFAHEKGARPCPLHGLDARLRFEAKMHLHGALQPATSLAIRVACRDERHGAMRPPAHVWMKDFNGVRVEYTVSSDAPDIVIQHDGIAVGLIEVRTTSDAGPGRTVALNSQGVPWIEVQAEDALQWLPERGPLPVRRLAPDGWECPLCAAQHALREGRSALCDGAERALANRLQGRRHLLWERHFGASLNWDQWRMSLQFWDLVDELDLPTFRVLVDGRNEFVLAAESVEELLREPGQARTRFDLERRSWLASLTCLGLDVVPETELWTQHFRPKLDPMMPTRDLRSMVALRSNEPEVYAAHCLLGVPPTMADSIVDAAYREAAKRWHPDRATGKDPAECNDHMAALNRAHTTIAGWRKRQR